jgi:hydrogenase maturation protease
MKKLPKILVYGYGNPGRQDDGLGNAFIELLDKWIEIDGLTNVTTDSNYQLNIEDADAIADKDIVIFVDASIEPIEDFILTKVQSSDSKIEFTMHAVSASFVLDLCHKIYKKFPDTYLLHIKGYEWDFKEELSKQADQNLNKALEFTKEIISNPEIIGKRVSTL